MLLRVALTALLAALGAAGWQTYRVAVQQAEIERLTAEARVDEGRILTCEARVRNILEAEERNGTIPDDLRDFDPSRWLLPPR